MPKSNANSIEADYASSFEATPQAPVATPSRNEMLKAARILAAEVTGVAATVEGAADAKRIRSDIVDAWRQWSGAWLAWHYYAERCPVDIAAAMDEVARQRAALATWRTGLRAEMTRAAQPQAPVADTKPQALKPSTWPWWVKVPVIGGTAIGAVYGIQWAFKQWFGGPEQHIPELPQSEDQDEGEPKTAAR